MLGAHGVSAWVRFLDAIDGFNQMKDYIEDESRLEHGKRIITENAKVASREITLQFTIEGGSEGDYRTKKKSFQSELEKGTVNIKIPLLETKSTSWFTWVRAFLTG